MAATLELNLSLTKTKLENMGAGQTCWEEL